MKKEEWNTYYTYMNTVQYCSKYNNLESLNDYSASFIIQSTHNYALIQHYFGFYSHADTNPV